MIVTEAEALQLLQLQLIENGFFCVWHKKEECIDYYSILYILQYNIYNINFMFTFSPPIEIAKK